MSDLDGLDAFNRLLERVEELSAENQRHLMANHEQRRQIEKLAHEAASARAYREDVMRLEKFVESTPELNANYMAFRKTLTTPPKADDIPF